MLISQGVTGVAVGQNYRGARLLIIVSSIAVAATLLVLSTTRRRSVKSR